MKPAMLALSAFRQSDNAVETALEQARESGHLVVVFVIDLGLKGSFIGVEIPPDLRQVWEQELLEEHRKKARETVKAIEERAKQLEIHATTHVCTGRFVRECLRAIERERPGVIVTPRSKKSKWVRKLFGSPLDRLIAKAGCRVIES